MGLFPLLLSNPVLFVIMVVLLLYSVIAHEIAHGWAAYLFGDDTAKMYGRLTLNPSSHIDPIGTLMLFLVGFGWAKPVPVDYYRIQRTRFGFIFVALAGCLTNILIAAFALFLLQLEGVNSYAGLSAFLGFLARINIILGSFNPIPIPPLDGSKILMSMLPYEGRQALIRIEPYGFFILAVLLFSGTLDPLIFFMQNLIYTFIGLLIRLFH